MKKMGKYCKAYPADVFQGFTGWAGQVKKRDDVSAVANPETSGAEDYWFIQEDYTVTKGIFLGEDVVFSEVTPAWIQFCKESLHFEIPAPGGSNVPAQATPDKSS